MIPLISPVQFKYIIYWSPKCACTTIRGLYKHLHCPNTPIQLINPPVVAESETHGYFKIAVVRHPYDRLVSAFVNKAVVFGAADDINKIVSDIAAKRSIIFDNVTFAMFVDYLHADFQQQKKRSTNNKNQNVALIDNPTFIHICKQVQNMPLDPHPLNMICKVENLKDDLCKAYSRIFQNHPKMLSKAIIYIQDLPFMNSTIKKTYPNSKKYHDVPIAVLKQMQILPTNVNFLTPHLMNLIFEMYKEDFESFGYTRIMNPPVERFQNDKLPADFCWQEYLQLNPEVATLGYKGQIQNTEESVKYFYMTYGRWLKHKYKKDK